MNLQRTLTIFGLVGVLVASGITIKTLADDSATAVRHSKKTKRTVQKVIRGIDALRQAQEYERESRQSIERRVDGYHVRPNIVAEK